jgi:serine protease Do
LSSLTAVEPNGPAAEQGFKDGDVILDVGGNAISTAADVSKALTEARTHGKHNILMRVKRADATRFVAMPIGQG